MLNKAKEKKNKMTLAVFVPWLQEKTGAGIRNLKDRTECVVSINHINPGCFAALYVIPSTDGLEVFEMTDHYESEAAAWQALTDNNETYPPVIFEEWVVNQYLTDRNAKVEQLKI